MYASNGFQRRLAACAILVTLASASRADIFRWDNGALIPGTEGITPGPGVQLDHRELEFANLNNLDLNGSHFESANLNTAEFISSTLTNSNFSGANLGGAKLASATLSNVTFDGANLVGATLRRATLTNASLDSAFVTGAHFSNTTVNGFTAEQLYSTASYKTKSLQGIRLGQNNLSGWNFHDQNLTSASLGQSTLTNADLSGAVVTGAFFEGAIGFTAQQLYATASYQEKNLRGISFSSFALRDADLTNWDFSAQDLSNSRMEFAKLWGADLSGAVVTGVNFYSATGFTFAQLFSTASYQAKNLQGILLPYIDVSGWDFHGQNLANAAFSFSPLANADFSGAVVTGAAFNSTGFTQEQLYSTASYQAKNLQGIVLGGNDLSGWDFSGQVVTGATFHGATSFGFTKEQLYSTASYKAKNLQGIGLAGNDLNGWDFHGQNLTTAYLRGSTFINADLSGADTRGVLFSAIDLTGADSVNLILPDGHVAGVTLTAGDELVVRNYLGDPSRQIGPIPITVQNEMIMEDGSVLRMLFDADSWNSTISFQSGISVTLGGSLELAFADGVDAAAQAGRTFDVFNWAGVSPTGAFTVASDYFWDLSQLYTTGDVTLLPSLAGDTDGDGQVGLNDLNNVRNHFGATGAPGLPGDAIPFDGIVDLADLNAVRNNFGVVGGSGAVPEPSTSLLAALGAVIVGCWCAVGRARRIARRRFDSIPSS